MHLEAAESFSERGFTEVFDVATDLAKNGALAVISPAAGAIHTVNYLKNGGLEK